MIFNWNGYPVDSDGNIYSKRNPTKKLTPHLNRKGYPMVGVMINNQLRKISVHKIVAEVFLGKCPTNYQVDHIDNDRKNFHPKNLRYVTASENVQKAYNSGLKNHSGFKASSSKYTETELCEAVKLIHKGLTNKHIVSRLGIKLGTVKKLRNGTHFYCEVLND